MEQNSIVVKNVTKKFDDFMLDHISFTVPTGRIVGFIGENGAGKSTTINLILDQLKLDAGEIRILGKQNHSYLHKENIGVVFDECKFHSVLNAKDIAQILSGSYKTAEELFYTLAQNVNDKKEEYDLKGIAISAPGAVDSKTGIIGGVSAIPYIHGPNFKEILKEKTGLDVAIENDANCAALGECWLGAAVLQEKCCQSFMRAMK